MYVSVCVCVSKYTINNVVFLVKAGGLEISGVLQVLIFPPVLLSNTALPSAGQTAAAQPTAKRAKYQL